MLVSLAFGIFILCVVYVAYWSVKNDAAGSIEEQVGFLRMRLPRNARTQPAKPLVATPSVTRAALRSGDAHGGNRNGGRCAATDSRRENEVYPRK